MDNSLYIGQFDTCAPWDDRQPEQSAVNRLSEITGWQQKGEKSVSGILAMFREENLSAAQIRSLVENFAATKDTTLKRYLDYGEAIRQRYNMMKRSGELPAGPETYVRQTGQCSFCTEPLMTTSEYGYLCEDHATEYGVKLYR